MVLDEIKLLYRRLYWDDFGVTKYIPTAILEWAESVIVENFKKAEDGGSKDKIVFKIGHTKKVVEAGLEIMENSSIYDWNLCQGMIVCFLHDIGRFPQALQNTFSDELSNMDHGKVGAEMVKAVGFADEEIYEAIEWHNKKDYLGNNIYTKLVRDADKIGLFRDFERLDMDSNEEGFVGNKVNEEVLKEFRKKACILDLSIKSKADWLINKASWFWDLNFDISKQIAFKEKMFRPIEDKLKWLNVEEKIIDEIVTGMRQSGLY